MNIDDAVDAVRTFHERISAPISQKPCLLPGDPRMAASIAEQLRKVSRSLTPAEIRGDVLASRAMMAIEELTEWLQAHVDDDLIAAADAWADRSYVLLGDAVAAGLPAAELFSEVHRSNMTKEPSPNESGKAVKGPSYLPPDLKPILEASGKGD